MSKERVLQLMTEANVNLHGAQEEARLQRWVEVSIDLAKVLTALSLALKTGHEDYRREPLPLLDTDD